MFKYLKMIFDKINNKKSTEGIEEFQRKVSQIGLERYLKSKNINKENNRRKIYYCNSEDYGKIFNS